MSATQCNRCCVFSHFDRDNIVDPYVFAYLKALTPYVKRILFVSTSDLRIEDIEYLKNLGVEAYSRKNYGYDFYSWKTGIEKLDLQEFDELLLVNDSCYAPLFSFESVFKKMDAIDCDYWSITKSYYNFEHAQSYFVCYRRPVITDTQFQQFWREMTPIENKRELIMKYEAGLSRLLLKSGFTMRQYFSISLKTYISTYARNLKLKISSTRNWNPYKYIRAILLSNPTFHFYQEMLDYQVPTIKVALLREDPFSVPATKLKQVAGIDSATLELIRTHQIRMGNAKLIEKWISA